MYVADLDTDLDADRELETAADQAGDLIARIIKARDRAAHNHTLYSTDGVELSAYGCLFKLESEGPVRSGALAQLMMSDPSTISRHVSQLVARNMVKRQADPQDGRATVLVITDEGLAKVASMRSKRNELMREIMSSWTPRERTEFVRLASKFVGGIEQRNEAECKNKGCRADL